MSPNPLGDMIKGTFTHFPGKINGFQGKKGVLRRSLSSDHRHNGHILGPLLEVLKGPGIPLGPLCLELFAQ